MRNKRASVKSFGSLQSPSILYSNLSGSTGHSSWLSQQLLSYYKQKSIKHEKDYDELVDIIENVRSACDFSNQLQMELRLRDAEVSKLQELIGDLQVIGIVKCMGGNQFEKISLFHQREENLKIVAENDNLKIQDYENKKKINLLLMTNGTNEKKFHHFMVTHLEKKLLESKLPPKLQKLREDKQTQIGNQINLGNELSNKDKSTFQTLNLKNQSLAYQLEQQTKIFKEQLEVLLKEKELLAEEKATGIEKIQKEVDLLSSKLKESHDLLCVTTKKLVYCQHAHEKDKTLWMEEKDKHVKLINLLKIKLGEDTPDLYDCNDNFADSVTRFCSENEVMRQRILEKEKLAASYQEQVMSLQNELQTLSEKAETCRQIFKEKVQKMAAQVAYLKNKYEDLNRRRHLEAEGFHTDIKMLRDRLRAVEKKLEKTSSGLQGRNQQQLLASAKNTLNRAKLLEKELTCIKSKIYALESNTERSTP